jgi:hypothetical protein
VLSDLGQVGCRATILASVIVSLSTASVEAQSACLPTDSDAVFVVGNLKAYAVGKLDGFGQRVLHLPLLTEAQADSEVVQSLNDSLCTIASQKINATIMTVDPSDNLPGRPVYLFLFANFYLVQTMYHGETSGIAIYDSSWNYVQGLLL